MRKFTFRVWAAGYKPPRMVQLEDIYVPASNTAKTVIDYINDGLYTLMQGSGVLDINKKEIFEGDLINVNGDTNSCEVIFKDGCFGFHYGNFQTLNTYGLEIVGNKYEK